MYRSDDAAARQKGAKNREQIRQVHERHVPAGERTRLPRDRLASSSATFACDHALHERAAHPRPLGGRAMQSRSAYSNSAEVAKLGD